jgi:hypothetical protein
MAEELMRKSARNRAEASRIAREQNPPMPTKLDII